MKEDLRRCSEEIEKIKVEETQSEEVKHLRRKALKYSLT
jgi:hypothetical protein